MVKKTPEASRMAEDLGRKFHENLNKAIAKLKATDGLSGDMRLITAARLARITSIDRSVLSRIISGERWATLEQMFLIAHALGDNGVLPSGAMVLVGRGPTHENPTETARAVPYLEDYAKVKGITKREEWYLKSARFEFEPWLAADLQFWNDILAAIRALLARADTDGAEYPLPKMTDEELGVTPKKEPSAEKTPGGVDSK